MNKFSHSTLVFSSERGTGGAQVEKHLPRHLPAPCVETVPVHCPFPQVAVCAANLGEQARW